MSDQPALLPECSRPVIHADDWNAIKRRVEYPNALAALIWAYQDGYRRALRDSHDAHLALGMPQPPEESA